MGKRVILTLSLAAAMFAGVLGLASTIAGASCTTACQADVSIYGTSNPNPLQPAAGHYSVIYVTAKDNGPNSAYGIDVHITVPYQLKIDYAKAYYYASPFTCSIQGTFINCDEGNFRREQLSTVAIKVQSRGKQGTYKIPAHVYLQGVKDPNAGNNAVTLSLGVYK